MTNNTKRAIIWILFAVGLIFGIIGWATTVYSSWTGTYIFLAFAFLIIALRISWQIPRK